MTEQSRVVTPGLRSRTVRTHTGETLTVPEGWELLPPGDPALTGRVKKAGPCWQVQEKRGRKTLSRGVWAPSERIASIREALEAERSLPAYSRKLDASRQRRQAEQTQYAADFQDAVNSFLGFAPLHEALARRLCEAIADHAVPVGSGTVARTKRIPIERRAEAATIAWLRHATTAYDQLRIPRVKGRRREVRRMLAERSRALLAIYRRGDPVAAEDCLLQRALEARDRGPRE